MRLYSRGQVVLFSISSFCLALLLALGFGVIKFPKDNSEPLDNIDPIATVKNTTEMLPEDPPLLQPTNNGLQQYSSDERENIQVYNSLNAAVVNINTEVITYNWFLDPVPQSGGSGSGIIFDKEGYILTNQHVVDKAYKVYVSMADGHQFDGKVIGTDAENDLAVIKIQAEDVDLVTIPLGSSEQLKVGQKVLAIGNPFGYERTLTTGIVSGLGRPLKNEKGLVMRDMIQTDASINPGNSGGPLLNSLGQMIGINTMIYSPSGGSVGIGFAVPVNTARRVIPDLIKFGKVNRGWIDIIPVQLFSSLVQYAKLPTSKGILVSRVTPGGNADKVGIKGGDRTQAVRSGQTVIYLGGDIITHIDGDEVKNLYDLYAALEDNKPGETIKVVVLRNKKSLTFNVVLSERPEQFQWE
ncbi:S1C family serine protease [Spirochaeta cellobiosiphila]|uniref:S1C family serine protease n=1 Tax=Spirochaeta cellobiosiphila TaxID=504483 RepID=UPI00041CD931|nr:trypsin-like peptidase domain-containing protein [Spirochaeta cellobiosiphila]